MKFLKIVFIFCVFQIHAQNQWLWHVDKIAQSYINPAYVSDHKFEISAASFGFDVNTNGIRYGDFITKQGNINEIDIEKLFGVLKESNYLTANTDFNTVDVILKLKGLNLSAGHKVGLFSDFNIDRDLIELIAKGNTPFIDKEVEIDLKGSLRTYHDFYLGLAKKVGPLSIGARFKFLNGLNNLESSSSKIKLLTKTSNYEISVENNIEVQSTNYLLEANLDNINVENVDYLGAAFTGNNGWGVDLGLTYNIGERIQFMANVMNIGSINWKQGNKEFINNRKSILKGVDIKDIIDGKANEGFEDSLKSILTFNTMVDKDYTTTLNPIFNLGLKYEYEGLILSGMITALKRSVWTQNNIQLQASKRFLKPLTVGLSYQYSSLGTSNLGLFFQSVIGPVNLFVGSQNLLNLFNGSLFNGANARFGGSLHF